MPHLPALLNHGLWSVCIGHFKHIRHCFQCGHCQMPTAEQKLFNYMKEATTLGNSLGWARRWRRQVGCKIGGSCRDNDNAGRPPLPQRSCQITEILQLHCISSQRSCRNRLTWRSFLQLKNKRQCNSTSRHCVLSEVDSATRPLS